MKYTFQYETKMEREQIINDNQDKYLIHEKNINDTVHGAGATLEGRRAL